MEYTPVYEFPRHLPLHAVLFPLWGVFVTAWFFALWRFRGSDWVRSLLDGMPEKGARRAPGPGHVLFGVVWTAIASTLTLGPALRTQVALRTGRMQVAEGVAEQFRPAVGKEQGSFDVAGQHFAFTSFGDEALGPAAALGGPIALGQPVRVHYVPLETGSNLVVRVEVGTPGVCRDPAAGAPVSEAMGAGTCERLR